MKPETKDKISAEAAASEYFSKLPAEIHGFTLKKIFADNLDKFNYFSYEKNHRSVTAYFHEETAEYKIRAAIGLSEFCLTEFFTGSFDKFTALLDAGLHSAIENFAAPVEDLIIADKKFSSWDYAQNLPKNLEGFELFIAPDKPARFTNGSYIILNYSDFDAASDLSIFYNAYTENFTGESKIRLVPQVSYLFDADNLKDLTGALEENLIPELHKIRKIITG